LKNQNSENLQVHETVEEREWIVGRNPVIEALKSGRPVHKLLIAKGEKEGSVIKIIQMAKDAGIPIQEADRRKMDQTVPGETHQGVIAQVAAYAYAELSDVLAAAEGKPNALVILLDGLQDPHNLGSILRTAHAVGADGVVIPKRRSVGLTATVAKTSAGAIEHVPVCRVSNLNQTLAILKEHGFWAMAADMAGDRSLYEADMKGRLAIVVGSEGEGVSRLVRENCDFVISIPMVGDMSSLNASVATGVILYEILRQNGHGKRMTAK